MFLHESAWPEKEQALELAVSLRKWLDTQVGLGPLTMPRMHGALW